ncbi:MAG: hypothetical protein MJ095_02230 [Oscillospiraceae bacterium]|nr:hypothetical protein [Oscillospiraceae bacterium]
MHELCVYIEAIRNKEECKFKDLHYLASLVRVAVVSAFNREVEVPSYESLMKWDGKIDEVKSNVHHGWEDSKAYMKAIQNHRR